MPVSMVPLVASTAAAYSREFAHRPGQHTIGQRRLCIDRHDDGPGLRLRPLAPAAGEQRRGAESVRAECLPAGGGAALCRPAVTGHRPSGLDCRALAAAGRQRTDCRPDCPLAEAGRWRARRPAAVHSAGQYLVSWLSAGRGLSWQARSALCGGLRSVRQLYCPQYLWVVGAGALCRFRKAQAERRAAQDVAISTVYRLDHRSDRDAGRSAGLGWQLARAPV